MNPEAIEVYFSGEIANNHRLSLRTIGKASSALQVALDRAYLEASRGQVWKHARMPSQEYELSNFELEVIREESVRVVTRRAASAIAGLPARLNRAIEKPYAQAISSLKSELSIEPQKDLSIAADYHRSMLESGHTKPTSYEAFAVNPPNMEDFANRSIAKQIDQIASIVRSKSAGDSTIEFYIRTEKSDYTYKFSRDTSRLFHKLVSQRELMAPVEYDGVLQQLDKKQLTGQLLNTSSGKRSKLLFPSSQAFESSVSGLVGKSTKIKFLGCPILEGGGYDAAAGDVFFLKRLK